MLELDLKRRTGRNLKEEMNKTEGKTGFRPKEKDRTKSKRRDE